MKGQVEYEQRFEKKIENMINENPEIMGFSNFMSSKSASTRYNYVRCIFNFINWCGKKQKDIDFDDFLAYFNKCKRTESGETTVPSYQITIYHALKKYGDYLKLRKCLSDNPMDYMDRPKAFDNQKTIKKRNEGYLTKEQVKAYLNEIICGNEFFKERDLAISLIFLTTGIRCAAMYKINLTDVDVDNKVLTVTDKGSKTRECKLSDQCCSAIKDWIRVRSNMSNVSSDGLFINASGERLSEKGILKMVEKYSKRFGKKISPHKLRATFGTQLYESTGDIYFVQQCMGHSSPKTTELYIRGQENKTERAADIMSKITLI